MDTPTARMGDSRPLKRHYTAGDVASIDYTRDVNDPGGFPYTRGIHPTGYAGKLWTMRQFSGFGTPQDTNARYKHLLAAGGVVPLEGPAIPHPGGRGIHAAQCIPASR